MGHGRRQDRLHRPLRRPPRPRTPTGADCTDVHEGVRRLLADIDTRLRRTRPDAIVEHRQPYTSPALWPYATMLRATDCPLSPAENRQRTIDCRLTAGPLAVHSDMIMWHHGETPENIAVHLINALFAVPQISVDLTRLTPDQLATLTFWLGVARRHRAALQLGTLHPARPELGYPLVRTHHDDTTVITRYAPMPVPLPDTGRPTLLVTNADRDTAVQLTAARAERAHATIQDCRGEILSRTTLDLAPGPNPVTVPTGGLLTLTREH